MMKRLVSDKLSRLYHDTLYERMLSFALTYTPEFPAEPVVRGWLERLYRGDDTLHILVDFDEGGTIYGHAVIEVQYAYGNAVVSCYQAYSGVIKKAKAHREGFNTVFEYIDKLAAQHQAICSIFYATKNAKVYQERFGYHIARTALVKQYGGEDEHSNADESTN